MNKNLKKTIKDLHLLSKISENFKISKLTVSSWSIAKHIDHILKVNNLILDQISKESVTGKPKRLSFIGKVILFTGFIPRKTAESPKEVIPEDKSCERINQEIQEIIKRLESVSESAFINSIVVNHPFLGGMTPIQWARFMYIHQKHHLKIIKDILK